MDCCYSTQSNCMFSVVPISLLYPFFPTMLLRSWALSTFSVRFHLTGFALFPFNHHIKSPKLLFVTHKSQKIFTNNNGLITPASFCAIRSDVSLELNVLPVKNCSFIQRCNVYLILKAFSNRQSRYTHTCIWCRKAKSTI